jgi:hypothetical protein
MQAEPSADTHEDDSVGGATLRSRPRRESYSMSKPQKSCESTNGIIVRKVSQQITSCGDTSSTRREGYLLSGIHFSSSTFQNRGKSNR